MIYRLLERIRAKPPEKYKLLCDSKYDFAGFSIGCVVVCSQLYDINPPRFMIRMRVQPAFLRRSSPLLGYCRFLVNGSVVVNALLRKFLNDYQDGRADHSWANTSSGKTKAAPMYRANPRFKSTYKHVVRPHFRYTF